MGLSDRHYAQSGESSRFADPPRSVPPSLGGRPAVWSVNTWLIVVNVAIFAVMAIFGSAMPTPVTTRSFAYDKELYERYPVLLRANGDPVKQGEKLVLGEPYFRTLKQKGSNPVVIIVDPATGGPFVAETVLATDAITAYGHFSTEMGFVKQQVWRLVTFQFLHGSISHLFFNMFGLFAFGQSVEDKLGGRKYLAFYLVCGIFGGLAYLTLNIAGMVAASFGFGSVPGLLFQDMHTTLVGASAGVFGVIMACARLYPSDEISVLFIPTPIKMKMAAYAYVAIAAMNLLIGGTNAGGDAAHIGGALAGFFFIVRSHLLTDFFDVFTDSRRAKGARPAERAQKADAKIEAILDKVQREGMHSLTQAERDELHAETERIRNSTR